MARVRPLVAMRAMKKVRENPDDTAVAIQVIGALSGNSGRRDFKRFERRQGVANVLRDKRVIEQRGHDSMILISSR